MQFERILFTELEVCVYMMATLGTHRYGDLSNQDPHLCFIYGETEDSWIGCWVFQFHNFHDIVFSKKTTRKLFESEIPDIEYIKRGEIGRQLLERHQRFFKIKSSFV